MKKPLGSKQMNRCENCGHLTEEGRRQQTIYSREHPIWNTDFSKKNSEIIEEVRIRLSRIRGTLYDIEYAYPVWKEYLEDVTGLLTCGLIVLADVAKEMEKVEEKIVQTVEHSLEEKNKRS